MKLGERITMLRKEQDMSQEEFAKLFFVTRQTVSNWENEKSYPDLQTLVDMSEKFGVSLDSLLKENAKIVEKLDKDRKYAKFSRILFAILGGMIGIAAILLGVWTVVWERTKQDMEERFNKGIEQYGFELTEADWSQQYILKAGENATFWVTPFRMYSRSSFYLGPVDYGVTCRIQKGTQLMEMRFYGDGRLSFADIVIYDKDGDHLLRSEEEQWALLQEDEQLKALWKQGFEIHAALYAPWIWRLDEGFNPAMKERGVPVLRTGDEAPDFTAVLTDGDTFTLSEQRGKITLINFWATWCDPCVEEMPAFERLKETYGDQLAILAVNEGEDADTVNKFLEDKGYTFPVALDEKKEVGGKYPVNSLPYTLILGADGEIMFIQLGGGDPDMMYQRYDTFIKAAISEQAED